MVDVGRPRRGAGRKPVRCSHCRQYLRNHPILRAVARRFDFDPIAFRSRIQCRYHPRQAFARQIAAYLLRLEGHTFRAIGGAMRRSTDMAEYSYKRICQLIATDPRVATLVKELNSLST